ncbi:hypothetical protein ACJX0J_023762, partial [Zea mays]
SIMCTSYFINIGIMDLAESPRFQAMNRKLIAMNKLLMEENEQLQKQVSQLVHENVYMKQLLQSNTFTKFLSKDTWTAIDWVQIPGMKPSPDLFGIVTISHGGHGVVARAFGLENLEPTKVCERSLSGSEVGQSATTTQYVAEVLHPLFEQIAQETREVVCALGRQPVFYKLVSIMGGDGIEDVIIACNSKKIKVLGSNLVTAFGARGGIICAKASMLLPPNFDSYSASALKTRPCSLPRLRPTRFSGSQIIMPLAQSHDCFLSTLTHDEGLSSRDIHLLQYLALRKSVNRLEDEKSMGSCFQLVFARIDEFFPDDAPLISSGFRVIPLDIKTLLNIFLFHRMDYPLEERTLDLASSLEVGATTQRASVDGYGSQDVCNLRSVLTIAFQFPYEIHLQDTVASSSLLFKEYQWLFLPPSLALNTGQKIISGFPEAEYCFIYIKKKHCILHACGYHLGLDLVSDLDQAGESLLRMFWDHQDLSCA